MGHSSGREGKILPTFRNLSFINTNILLYMYLPTSVSLRSPYVRTYKTWMIKVQTVGSVCIRIQASVTFNHEHI